MQNPVDLLINEFVCVEANGVRYFGTLVEIGEEELMLKSTTRWISVALERVSSVRAFDPAELEGDVEEVDTEAYETPAAEEDES